MQLLLLLALACASNAFTFTDQSLIKRGKKDSDDEDLQLEGNNPKNNQEESGKKPKGNGNTETVEGGTGNENNRNENGEGNSNGQEAQEEEQGSKKKKGENSESPETEPLSKKEKDPKVNQEIVEFKVNDEPEGKIGGKKGKHDKNVEGDEDEPVLVPASNEAHEEEPVLVPAGKPPSVAEGDDIDVEELADPSVKTLVITGKAVEEQSGDKEDGNSDAVNADEEGQGEGDTSDSEETVGEDSSLDTEVAETEGEVTDAIKETKLKVKKFKDKKQDQEENNQENTQGESPGGTQDDGEEENNNDSVELNDVQLNRGLLRSLKVEESADPMINEQESEKQALEIESPQPEVGPSDIFGGDNSITSDQPEPETADNNDKVVDIVRKTITSKNYLIPGLIGGVVVVCVVGLGMFIAQLRKRPKLNNPDVEMGKNLPEQEEIIASELPQEDSDSINGSDQDTEIDQEQQDIKSDNKTNSLLNFRDSADIQVAPKTRFLISSFHPDDHPQRDSILININTARPPSLESNSFTLESETEEYDDVENDIRGSELASSQGQGLYRLSEILAVESEASIQGNPIQNDLGINRYSDLVVEDVESDKESVASGSIGLRVSPMSIDTLVQHFNKNENSVASDFSHDMVSLFENSLRGAEGQANVK